MVKLVGDNGEISSEWLRFFEATYNDQSRPIASMIPYISDEMWADMMPEMHDPSIVTTINGVKRRTDKDIVPDAIKAAIACGKLREDEPYWLREEADGGVSVVRGNRPG